MQAATDEGRTANLVYFVFDLLFLDGEKLAGLPLLERKERLKALVEGAPRSIQSSAAARARASLADRARCVG